MVPNAHVVAPGSRTRQARVLSPYQWEFGDSDDGAAVAAQLGSMPDYAGNVVHVANATSSATDVSVDDFQGWQGLDVVHVVSHGFRVCAQRICRAAIAAHSVPNGLADLIANRVRGLELEVSVGPDDSLHPRHHVLLGADFFRAEYPRGLDDAVVFLNGCATFGQGATDLADAIRGGTSVVLGWDQTVATTAAHDAGVAVFDELGGNGRTVGDALEELGPLATSLTTDRAGRPITAKLTSSGRKAGGDLRIRDIVQFSNTAGTGPLSDGSEVAIVGVAQDGLVDSVAWQVRIDGIEPAAASALVRVTIDGNPATPVAVSTGSMQAPNAWLISGTVQLGSDFVEEYEAPFEAVLELPEGGLSTTTLTAIIVGQAASVTPAPAPAMGTLWRGHLTYSFEVKPGVTIEAEADVDFAFDGGSESILIYPAVSGRMSYSVHGTTPEGCTSTLAPVEVAITPDNVSGGLRIDVSTSPPIFEGTVSVTGPEVEVMQTCVGEYAYLTGPYTTVARAVFIQVFFSDTRTVEGDAIRGSNNTAIDSRTFDIRRVE
jgi:hypothetical protein